MSMNWKVEIWGRMPGAPQDEIVDSKDGFYDEATAEAWVINNYPNMRGSARIYCGKAEAYEMDPEEKYWNDCATWNERHSHDDEGW